MTPKVGQVEDGYGFIGGDPSDKNSWKQVGSVEDGHTYLGGDPSKQESWKPVEVQSPSSYAMKDEPIEVFQESNTPFMERALSSTPVDTLRGLGKGVTFGFGDELAGAVGATIDPLLYGNEEGKTWKERYKENRDFARKDYEQASERSPVATTVGEIGGSIASPVSKIGSAAKGAKALAGVGALQGGLFGLGESESEDVGGMLVDTAKGATIGGALGFGAGKAGEYLSNKAATTGKELEQKGTAKILGTFPADADKMAGHGVKAPALNRSEGFVESNVSKELPNFVKENKFSPITSYDKMSRQLAEVKGKAGEEIGSIAMKYDSMMAMRPEIKSQLAYKPDMTKIDDVLERIKNAPGYEGDISKINSIKEKLALADGTSSLKELQDLRRLMDDKINYNRKNQDMSIVDDVFHEIRSDISDHIRDVMLKGYDDLMEISKGLGAKDPAMKNLRQKIIKSNYDYVMATEAEKVLNKSIARNAKNEIFNIKDILGGLAGSVALDPLTGGLGGFVARRVAEKGGQWAQQRAPELMRGTGTVIRKALPTATQQVQEIDPIENFLNNPNMKK